MNHPIDAPMKISVVIATYNRPLFIEKCILSLLRSTYPPCEIIVVDQSDNTATKDILKGIQAKNSFLRYEKLSCRGKSLAVNHAIKLAAGEFLALTDDDVIVDCKWIENLVKLHEQYPEIDAFCGRLLPEENTSPEDYLNLVGDKRQRRIDRKTNPLHTGFGGANIMIKRKTMINAGMYNIDFGPGGKFKANEDGELSYRLTRTHTSILYSPRLPVYHSGWRREEDNLKLESDYAFSLGAFAGYYLCRWDPIPLSYLVRDVILRCRELVFDLILRQKQEVKKAVLYLKGVFHGFIAALDFYKFL